jgi:hypothetical protein
MFVFTDAALLLEYSFLARRSSESFVVCFYGLLLLLRCCWRYHLYEAVTNRERQQLYRMRSVPFNHRETPARNAVFLAVIFAAC